MNPFRTAAVLAALTLLGAPAQAQDCPPGLAKKSPACVPPGLAKKAGDKLERGDILPGGYDPIHDRYRHRLPPLGPGEEYYRMGDRILRVDAGTKRILDIVALTASLVD